MVSDNTKSRILIGMLVIVSVYLWIMIALPPPEIEVPGIIPEVEIEIETPEITMHKGETKVIPITIHVNNEATTYAKLWVHSTDLECISAESPIN